MLHRVSVELKSVCRRSWTDVHLPGRHAGVGPQHRSSVELDSDDGCLQNEANSLQLVLIPKVSGTASAFKGVLNPKMPLTHPCRHLFGHFWFFQHCDARLRSGTESNCPGGSGGDTRSKPKPLQPTSA